MMNAPVLIHRPSGRSMLHKGGMSLDGAVTLCGHRLTRSVWHCTAASSAPRCPVCFGGAGS